MTNVTVFRNKEEYFYNLMIEEVGRLRTQRDQKELIRYYLQLTQDIVRWTEFDLVKIRENMSPSIKNDRKLMAYHFLCENILTGSHNALKTMSEGIFSRGMFPSFKSLEDNIGSQTYNPNEFPAMTLFKKISIFVEQIGYVQQVIRGRVFGDKDSIDVGWVFDPKLYDVDQKTHEELVDLDLYKSVILNLEMGYSHLQKYRRYIFATYLSALNSD